MQVGATRHRFPAAANLTVLGEAVEGEAVKG
jgi:hypothetical protein